jgi:hypothetical protein
MLKFILLAGTMALSVPAVAQDKPVDSQATPMSQPAPAQTAPTPADATQAQPASPASPATAQSAPTAQDPTQAAPAQAAAAQPASKADQVAQVVNAEFPTYDKDSNGSLSKTEFAAWMVALRKASDPTIKPESAATKKWIGDAFAQADTDKSKSVSKTELEGFLAQS